MRATLCRQWPAAGWSAAMFGTLVRDIFLGAKLTFFFAYIVGRALLNVDLFVSIVALLWTKFKLTFF